MNAQQDEGKKWLDIYAAAVHSNAAGLCSAASLDLFWFAWAFRFLTCPIWFFAGIIFGFWLAFFSSINDIHRKRHHKKKLKRDPNRAKQTDAAFEEIERRLRPSAAAGLFRHRWLWSDRSNCLLRQDPLDLSFWSFFTFWHHGIEEVERQLLWNFMKKSKGKVGQMCHRSCSLA